MALVTTRDQPRTEIPPPSIVAAELSFYDILGTHRGATDEEIRDAQEQEDGLFRFELTVVIDPVTHVNGHRDVDDVSVEDYVIVGLEDFELGASDASMLRDTLGELTDSEERNIKRDVFFDV